MTLSVKIFPFLVFVISRLLIAVGFWYCSNHFLANDAQREATDIYDMWLLLEYQLQRERLIDWELLDEYFPLFNKQALLTTLKKNFSFFGIKSTCLCRLASTVVPELTAVIPGLIRNP
jgi:hypothetical protein